MKRLRPLWILIGIAATVRGGFFLAVWSVERVQLAAITCRTEALKADFDSRDYCRPVLRGRPESGNAWDCYLPALFELDAEGKFSNTHVDILSDYIWSRPTADRVKVEDILTRHGAILDRLRGGTRRIDTRFPYDWTLRLEAGVEFGHPDFRYDWKTDWDHRNPHLGHQAVCYLTRAQARWHREQGRPMEAAELLLDLLQFERDRAHNDFWNTHGHFGSLQDELQGLLVSRTLSPSELGRLASELAILTEHGPEHTHLFRNAILKLGMDFREELKAGRQTRIVQFEGSEVTAGLADLYSYRLMNARAFWFMDRSSEKLRRGACLNWNEAQALVRTVYEEIERGDRLFDLLTNIPTSSGQIQRKEAAMLLLLRAGAHYLATGEVLELPDPFGNGPLKSKAGETLKIWSVGCDGTDNDGRGSWRGIWNEDLVLELKR